MHILCYIGPIYLYVDDSAGFAESPLHLVHNIFIFLDMGSIGSLSVRNKLWISVRQKKTLVQESD